VKLVVKFPDAIVVVVSVVIFVVVVLLYIGEVVVELPLQHSTDPGRSQNPRSPLNTDPGGHSCKNPCPPKHWQ